MANAHAMMIRVIVALFAILCGCIAARAQTPTFNSLAVSGPGTINATGQISGGSLAISGGGNLSGAFNGPFTMNQFSGQLTSITPAPTSPGIGYIFYYPGCANGNQGVGAGTSPTGCPAFFDNNGQMRTMPNPPSASISIGGQTLYLGGATTNQGAGSLLLTCNPPFVNGNAIITNASGTCVDGGAPPGGGGGGSGTVGNCAVSGSSAYYAASGTAITCLSQTNSSVLSRSSGGVLAEVTTLPSALTIPTATISNPAITGTATVVAATFTGKLTTAASVALGGANLNCPQGTAPNTPGNGDLWCTSAGLFGRFNGTTYGPFIGTAQLSGTAPIGFSAGVISCATCATTTSGGALSGTAPIAISSGGAISIGEVTVPVAVLLWNSTTTVTSATYEFYWGHATGHITKVVYYTGGTATPSFNVAVNVNGVGVTGCTAISVTAANTMASPGSTTCTSTAITSLQPISIVTSGIGGAPAAALVEVLGTASAT